MAIPVPLSSTDVRIYANIPFSKDYEHVRWFTSVTQQTNYFDSQTLLIRVQQAKFVRSGDGKGTFDCPAISEALLSANYMRFINDARWYCCFIDKVEYINNGCTRIHFTLDLMQTYRTYMSFNPCLIEREHRQEYTLGKPNPFPLPEGLDYGDDYVLENVEYIIPNGGVKFLVIAAKRAFHVESNDSVEPNVNGLVQGLTYYVHPVVGGDLTPIVKVAGTTYVMSEPKELLEALYNHGDAVENIVSMYYTWATGLQFSYDEDDVTASFSSGQVEAVTFPTASGYRSTLHVKNVYPYVTQLFHFDDVYSGLYPEPSAKLMNYPYTVFVLTDLQGNQMELKPELFSSDNITVKVLGSMGTSNKVAYAIDNYKASGFSGMGSAYYAYHNSLINESPNSIPILSNYLSAYLQGNANSIQTKMNSAFTNGVLGAVSGVGAIASGAITRNAGGAINGVMSTADSTANSLLTMQSIQAQIKDISNLPPSLNSQGSNSNFDFGHQLAPLVLLKFQIRNQYKTVLSNFFKMYGYKVNSLGYPNTRTKTRFNYLKLIQANINVDAPKIIEEEIKKIFLNGVTLWHVDDMKDYTPPNEDR